MVDEIQMRLDAVVKDGNSIEEWYRGVDGAIMELSGHFVTWGSCYRVGDFAYVSPDDFEGVVSGELADLYVCVANLVDAAGAMTYGRAAGIVRDGGVGRLLAALEPLSNDCRDAVYFTEMHPDCYSEADLEEAAAARPDLFTLEYCNRYPELQPAAVSKGLVDLFDLADPSLEALASWFDARMGDLSAVAVDRVAGWGGNMSVPGGWVTEEQWDAVFPDDRGAEVFRIYEVSYGDEDRLALLAHLSDMEWLAAAGNEAIDDASCECYYTEIWPDDFSASELDDLRASRPDLFTGSDIECFEALASYEPAYAGSELARLEEGARTVSVAHDQPGSALEVGRDEDAL